YRTYGCRSAPASSVCRSVGFPHAGCLARARAVRLSRLCASARRGRCATTSVPSVATPAAKEAAPTDHAAHDREDTTRFRTGLRCSPTLEVEEAALAKIPKVLHEHINTAFPSTPCLVATVLPNGFAQVSPRGSTMVFDDEHIALWERGK